ncbi:MFS transporter [Nocardioides cynanchi]|uniref:MFS transporter n=1 Tax=Nocardioides cynanchi TaxID=2558918 RepID=UPI0012483E53|nr:MFS transporter [Nocardioides cynanchi]
MTSPGEPARASRRDTVVSGARVTGRGLRSVARGTGRLGRGAFRTARRAAAAEGADTSGLARLIELGALNAAADAAVAISLAGTLFFQIPTGEARGQVSLFLGLTMLPFAIVAPLIGPLLDRFSHGRRWAIGATMAVRAFLVWVLAGSVTSSSVWLFPAALGVLIASKAYNVTRAAAVPRLLPHDLSLVTANARTSMAGMVGVAVSAPIAAAASTFGPEWSLRYAFLVFVVATILAIRLPARVDSSQGEDAIGFLSGAAVDDPTAGTTAATATGAARRRRTVRIPSSMAFALRANCGPRWLSGFLTLFMAFLLRVHPIAGHSPKFLLAAIIGAAGVGNVLGLGLGSVLKNVHPKITLVLALLADAAAVTVAALFYGLLPLVVLGFTAGLTQCLAKLSLDSTIQRDVPERVQTSAFARSDTTLQLAWVIGGFVGIAMPLQPRLGLIVAAVVLVAWSLFVLANVGRRTPAPRPAPTAA